MDETSLPVSSAGKEDSCTSFAGFHSRARTKSSRARLHKEIRIGEIADELVCKQLTPRNVPGFLAPQCRQKRGFAWQNGRNCENSADKSRIAEGEQGTIVNGGDYLGMDKDAYFYGIGLVFVIAVSASIVSGAALGNKLVAMKTASMAPPAESVPVEAERIVRVILASPFDR
jgi:hypothetical protein